MQQAGLNARVTAKRIALYVRVSGMEQAERGSVETQIEFLKSYAKLRHWEIVEIYRDEPVSGSSVVAERPEGGRLLRDAARGRFDAVLVYKLDRLARSVYQLHRALQALDAASVAFLSATEAYDTATPYGRMILNLMAAFAEWERDLISERSHEGRKRAAREGRWPGGPPPLGYRLEEGKLVADEEALPGLPFSEAALIRRIFVTIGEGGKSVYTLVTLLNEERVPNGQACNYPRHKTGKQLAAGWRDTTLRKILKNPVYYGTALYGKGNAEPIAIPAPAIVTRALWDAAQAQLLRNQRFSPRNTRPGRIYLLQGLIRCGDCGHRMSGTTPNRGARKSYYVCRGRHDPRSVWGDSGRRCASPILDAATLEAQLWADITRFVTEPQSALAELARDLEGRRANWESVQAEADRLASLLKGAEEHRRRALSLFVRGQINEREKDMLLAEIEAETAAMAEAHAEKLTRVAACREEQAQMSMAEQLLARFGEVVRRPHPTPEERQRIFRGAIQGMETLPDGGVRVRYVFDPIEHTATSSQVLNWGGFEVVYPRLAVAA